MKAIRLLLTTSVFCFIFQLGNATIWRVNNIPGALADFNNFNSAQSAAAPGDTIHLEPGGPTYGVITITKRLTIFGTGYLLGQNPGLQASNDTVLVGNVNFNSGAKGSKISGVTISGNLVVSTDSIFIIRNRFSDPNYWCSAGGNCNTFTGNLQLSGTRNYIYIIGNLVNKIVTISASQSNVYILNNIINGTIKVSLTSGLVVNNVIVADPNDYASNQNGSYIFPIEITNSIVRNNIIRGSDPSNLALKVTFTSFGCIVDNNFDGGDPDLPSGNGNQNEVDMTTVFELTGSLDGQFQLKAGSPALGAGYYDGEDCGAFDIPPGYGWTPYKLSGIPSIPTIYMLSSEQVSDTLQVTLSTRSNN